MKPAAGLHLAGVGSWLPAKVSTADAVARGWYAEADRKDSGVLAVRVAGDLPAPEMAVWAARTALRRAARTGLGADDYGALLHCATYHQGPDGWSAPHYVLHRTLDRPIGAAQVGPGCLAMLTALEMAAHRLAADPAKDAVLLTAADNFSAPLVDRWNSSRLFLLADGAAAAVVSRRDGFARILSVGSVSAPSMEELHRGGEELFPPGITVGRSLNFEERSSYWRRQWAEGAAPPKVHLGDVVASAADRVLAEAETDLDQVARICHTAYTEAALHTICLDPLDTEAAHGTWDLVRHIGHVGAGDPFIGLERLWTRGEVAVGDRVLLLAAGPGMEVACAVVEITRPYEPVTEPEPAVVRDEEL